jgi:hypothetical protein
VVLPQGSLGPLGSLLSWGELRQQRCWRCLQAQGLLSAGCGIWSLAAPGWGEQLERAAGYAGLSIRSTPAGVASCGCARRSSVSYCVCRHLPAQPAPGDAAAFVRTAVLVRLARSAPGGMDALRPGKGRAAI